MNRFFPGTGLPALLIVVCCFGTTGFASGGEGMDISGPRLQRLLFIHHSCGGQLLAAPGPQSGGEKNSGARCIYKSHPNGGDLRQGLIDAGYEVHELSYESELGEDTDIHHWRRKFTENLAKLLTIDNQDRYYQDGRTNEIIVFKSCFPNNNFIGRGREPGDPDSPQLTVANAKAAYRALLPVFASQPEVLFVALSAPPMVQIKPTGLKGRLKAMLKKKPLPADLAREFNTWLVDNEQGWLSGYGESNIVVFDYYDILTANGASNWLEYPTGNGRDSHPSVQGNSLAAEAFVPFLDAAVSRMR